MCHETFLKLFLCNVIFIAMFTFNEIRLKRGCGISEQLSGSLSLRNLFNHITLSVLKRFSSGHYLDLVQKRSSS